ncbi:DM13 domain-containing protein [uncultured Sulfitobacter sp.]|uniref:DM13 domain-containing protein n=1 Tax=uncultured Sulfitobacter sp. TaxID=191468 RepID=UPI002622E2AD|nr:DM13 domain-containing protein [uncultured Sulfitobacter sp.]
MRRFIVLGLTHLTALAAGFALGVYLLPILTAPPSPDQAVLQEQAKDAMFTAELTRELKGSDILHWGEGTISITPTNIVHEGKLAPGPDYKLYLLTEFVEHEDEFLPIKDQAQLIGDIKTFNGFVLSVPEGIDPADYTTVLVWCEAFSEFITAAKFR